MLLRISVNFARHDYGVLHVMRLIAGVRFAMTGYSLTGRRVWGPSKRSCIV